MLAKAWPRFECSPSGPTCRLQLKPGSSSKGPSLTSWVSNVQPVAGPAHGAAELWLCRCPCWKLCPCCLHCFSPFPLQGHSHLPAPRPWGTCLLGTSCAYTAAVVRRAGRSSGSTGTAPSCRGPVGAQALGLGCSILRLRLLIPTYAVKSVCLIFHLDLSGSAASHGLLLCFSLLN